ncbi:MAG: ABC transporter substrate-binding protein [Patescibacteria group bacterium]
MNKTLKIVIGLVILVVIVWAVSYFKDKNSSNTGADSGGVIKIGIIAPLTGTASSYGVEGKNSVVLAFDEINASGGIAGKKIEYTVEDGKCDAKASIDAWTKLVSVNKVSMVFGGHCSTETMAIAPLSARDNVPVFAVFTTTPVIPNEGEWLFRHVSTNEYYGTILAGQAFKSGHKKAAVLTEVKDFPVTYSDAFIKAYKALGGEIVLDERFDPQTKDYRTIALKLKGLNYDTLFINTQGADVAGLITNQIKELGLGKAYLYNHAFAPAKFLEITKGYMPADYIIVSPFTDPNTPKVKAFNSAYTEKFGDIYKFSTFFVTADYDLVHRVKDAADACQASVGYSIDCVRDQFKAATSYAGVAGNVTVSSQYSPKGVLTPVGLLKVGVGGATTIEPVK